MKSRPAVRVAATLVVLALLSWAFVTVIWIPLYGEQPPVQAEVTREDRSGVRTWSLQDQQALRKLQDGLRQADYSGANAPNADRKFRVRIRRSDARIDEYEVVLDDRGRDQDLLYVVRRRDGASMVGSATPTPELRSALRQILKEPAAP